MTRLIYPQPGSGNIDNMFSGNRFRVRKNNLDRKGQDGQTSTKEPDSDMFRI